MALLVVYSSLQTPRSGDGGSASPDLAADAHPQLAFSCQKATDIDWRQLAIASALPDLLALVYRISAYTRSQRRASRDVVDS